MYTPRILTFLLAICGFYSICTPQIVINEVMASNISTQLDPGYTDFGDWIELYNKGDLIDIGGMFVTDDFSDPYKWQIPEGTFMPPDSYYIIWASGPDSEDHASFKLSASGDQIGIYSPEGQIIDTLTFGKQLRDISYGRYPNGGSQWQYFAIPTHSQANDSPGLNSPEQLSKPDFSPKGGFYNGNQSVTIAAGPGITIRYTKDGSIPTKTSTEYNGPINLNATSVLRARGFHDNLLPSDVTTHSYIVNEPALFPLISIATPPEYLFDDEIGISTGICISDEPGAPPPFDWTSNYWNRWERPVHIEYYTPDGHPGFSQDAGIAIFGGFLGRQLRQKAFSLYARGKYGDSDFDFPLFPSKPVNSYRRFILRCSSNDFNRTFIRDAMMQTLVIGQMDVDYQAYQPVIVYINGEFWGLYNMREKTNQFYPEHNYGIDSDLVDLVEGIKQTAHGDGSSYQDLLDYVSGNDMAHPENYEYVRTQMDVTEFMNYFITEIFVDNRDWLHQNIKCWREHSEDGKWRWLLYDMDWGFSGELHGRTEDYANNTLQWVLEQGEASILFQKLIGNEAFRFEFIQRFTTHLNLTFATERVHDIIGNMAERIAPEIPRQIERWEALQNMDYWHGELDILYRFALERPHYISEHLRDVFMMDGKSHLFLEVSNQEAGWISVFDTPCPGPAFSGLWYEGIPLKIEAHANPGWKFVGWQGNHQSEETSIDFSFMGNSNLYAGFEPRELPSIVINEIHYNPSKDLQGADEEFEFLELLNYGEELVDISGFHFTEGIDFTFTQGTIINPGEYIILAGDPKNHTNEGIQIFQIWEGRLDNSGEVLSLCDPENRVVDQVHFDDHYPWPREPDGEGPSLELISPALDNSLASSWKASEQTGGTPGTGKYTGVEEAGSSMDENLRLSVSPNPFHYTCKIKYALSEESQVIVKIFNGNGQELTTLVSKKQAPGNFEILWKPLDLPGGIYFIYISTEGYTRTEKVLHLNPE